jgi:hypothetical protein
VQDAKWHTSARSSQIGKQAAQRPALAVGIVLMTAPHEPRNWIRKEMFTEYEQAQRMEQFIAASVSPTKDLRHAT